MAVSLKTQKHIWGSFAARCAMCREHLIHQERSETRSLVGEIAHIVGDRPGSARADYPLPQEERDEPDNLILLCRKHHKIIDDNPTEYPVERLRLERSDHIRWVEGRLEKPKSFSLAVSAFTYLNVPRLSEFAARQGFSVRGPDVGAEMTLRDLGFALNQLTAAFRATLHNLSIDAVPASSIRAIHEGYIGQIVEFERLRFRTRNIPLHRPAAGEISFVGNLTSDPHIYHRFADWTLILNVNPRWITTDTAYGMFRPSGGASAFSGFGRVVDVDYENGRLIASALAIGTPDSRHDFSQAETAAGSKGPVDLAHLEDGVSKAGAREWYSELKSCDLCGRHFSTETYMVDGGVRGLSGWACMCSCCFVDRGVGLGLAKGQLYRRVGERWHLVGGYPLPPADEEADEI